MEFGTLIEEYQITSEQRDSILENELRSQIVSLETKMKSLESILEEKDKKIQRLVEQHDSISDIVYNAVNKVVHGLKNAEIKRKLSNVLSMENLTSQVTSFLDIITSMTLCEDVKVPDDRSIVERLRSQLYSHIELLTQIIENPSGKLSLPDGGAPDLTSETKKNLLSFARDTKKILDETVGTNLENVGYNPISYLLSPKNSYENRVENLRSFFESYNISQNELKDLLVQEVTVSGLLSKLLLDKQNQKGSREVPRHSSFETKKAQNVFENLCEALGKKYDFSPDNFITAANLVASDICNAQKKLRQKPCSFTDFIEINNVKIRRLESQINQLEECISSNADQLGKLPANNEWVKWASRVYAGLMGVGEEAESNKVMQIAIEHAALCNSGYHNPELRKYIGQKAAKAI